MKSIREKYENLGVEKFYEEYGNVYENPHFPYIQQLLKQNEHRIDYSKVLDFCCGGGEVSMVLKELGYSDFEGSDPYTYEAYFQNIGQQAFDWSFEDVIKGEMVGEYSAIICSFALHLCEEKKLYSLVSQLFTHTKLLIILTPHKRPELENLQGIELLFEDSVLTTERGKKVRLKAYRKFNAIHA